MTSCSEDEYLKLLEQLIRGRCLKKPIDATRLFATQYQKQLEAAGCLGESREIVIDKLKEAFKEEKINYRQLSEAILSGAQ